MQKDISVFTQWKKPEHWSISQKGDLVLSSCALSQILLGIVQGVLIAYGMDEKSSTLYRVVLSAIPVLIAFPILIKRKATLVVSIYFIIILIYAFHTIAFPSTIVYWHKEATRFTLPISVPCALCVIAVKEKQVFYYVLKLLAYISGFLCLLYGLSIYTGRYDIGFSYNQGIGYALLFPILVLFYDRKWYSLFFSAILMLICLLYGSRGPILSIGLFVVYYLFVKKKYFYMIALALFLLVGISFLESFIESQGLSSRTLELYLSGDLDNDNGRDVITAEIMKGINQRPLTGWGIFGDRVITGGANYAHSLIREIWAEFGLYLGTLILGLFAFKIIKTFLKLQGVDRDMFSLFLFACVAPVLVSGSYLTNTNFAVFIGVMYMLSPNKKRLYKKLDSNKK